MVQRMVKLAIPVEKFEKEKSIIFPHFGRAPIFAVIDLLDDGSVKSITHVENSSEHFGGQGSAETLISSIGPNALVVKGMGPRGLEAFQSNGIAVFTGDVNTVGEAIDAYVDGRLIGLTEPCREARHQFGCH
jgi:predicted Fe-Mo cluster-binding NifX family protein